MENEETGSLDSLSFILNSPLSTLNSYHSAGWEVTEA